MSDTDLTRYRHVDGMEGDWEEHAELMKHTKSGGSYEMRYSDPTDTMPDGVVVVRDSGGDIDSFMVPDDTLQRCDHQWLPWLTLPNGSSWTQCVNCEKEHQYDH